MFDSGISHTRREKKTWMALWSSKLSVKRLSISNQFLKQTNGLLCACVYVEMCLNKPHDPFDTRNMKGERSGVRRSSRWGEKLWGSKVMLIMFEQLICAVYHSFISFFPSFVIYFHFRFFVFFLLINCIYLFIVKKWLWLFFVGYSFIVCLRPCACVFICRCMCVSVCGLSLCMCSCLWSPYPLLVEQNLYPLCLSYTPLDTTHNQSHDYSRLFHSRTHQNCAI